MMNAVFTIGLKTINSVLKAKIKDPSFERSKKIFFKTTGTFIVLNFEEVIISNKISKSNCLFRFNYFNLHITRKKKVFLGNSNLLLDIFDKKMGFKMFLFKGL
jgi:hypothetical protein